MRENHEFHHKSITGYFLTARLGITELNERTLRNQYVCFLEFAVARKDYNICIYLNSMDQKEACTARIAEQKGSAASCEQIKNPYWFDYCFQGVAVMTGTTAPCGKIKNAQSSAENPFTLHGCISAVAKQNNDPNICYQISETQDLYYCLEGVNQPQE